mmetsp:Transcript_68381/g.160316  ORF Transcript_68381/g.160316 Transcript_68381/m.160316 type:complete len:249 (+) Transcript_68381:945-1691(+)
MSDSHRKARVDLFVLDTRQGLPQRLLQPAPDHAQCWGDREVWAIQHPIRLFLDVRVRMKEDKLLFWDSTPPSLLQRHQDDCCALVNIDKGVHGASVWKGDVAVTRPRCRDLLWGPRMWIPSIRWIRSCELTELGHQACQLALVLLPRDIRITFLPVGLLEDCISNGGVNQSGLDHPPCHVRCHAFGFEKSLWFTTRVVSPWQLLARSVELALLLVGELPSHLRYARKRHAGSKTFLQACQALSAANDS